MDNIIIIKHMIVAYKCSILWEIYSELENGGIFNSVLCTRYRIS